MNKHNPYQAPKVTFTTIAPKTKMSLYLALYDDSTLLSDMRLAADREDYDAAIILRNELIRRGILQIDIP